MTQNSNGRRFLKALSWKCTPARSLTTLMILVLVVFVLNYKTEVQSILPRRFVNIANFPSDSSGNNRALRDVEYDQVPQSSSLTASSRSLSVLPESKVLSRLADMAKVRDVDCHAIFGGSENATRKAQNVTKTRRKPLGNDYYINETADCKHFQTSRGYIMSSLTKTEEDFPIAYSMLVYKEPEIVERLLRAIYRPQNFYCIHVDKKSPEDFHKAMEGLALCFPNVFIAHRKIDVQWGEFTVLEPELVCMEDLWRYRTWRYFINLTGQEFPLKTNFELVKILIAFKGANGVHGTITRSNRGRWKYAGTPPHNIRPLKGSVHVALNRDFVDYILHNDTARDFLNWTRKTQVPDEAYFATLNYNPQLGIRGSFKGDPDVTGNAHLALTRYKIWYNGSYCAGRLQRGICILTTGDLGLLDRAWEMFANKFYFDEDQVVIECLEERLFNNTRDEYMGTMTFNTSYYENADFVKNQVL